MALSAVEGFLLISFVIPKTLNISLLVFYQKYALDALNDVTAIVDELKNNPESIFDEYHKLHGLEMGLHHARVIAKNVAKFSHFGI